MKRAIIRVAVVALAAAMLPMLSATPAQAAESTGTGISYTLEGCRASVDSYLAATDFRCQDAQYTTGNLGKGWNEFDLVPGRVTVKAGNSAPATQSFGFVIAVDNCSTGDGATGCTAGRPGYDRLSSNSGGTPVLNTSSTGTCGSISASAPRYAPPSGEAIGGTGTTLYRVISITGQAKNSNCVYDFFARLAFNSHLYPGSSLHFNLANTDLGVAGIGAKDVSIPVSGILPPGFSKTQDSSQGSSSVWTVAKTSTPANFGFSETCPATANPQQQAVTVTITWTKLTAVSGAITVRAVISLVNNAHRAIDATVEDQLYHGSLTPGAGTAYGPVQTRNVTLGALGDATASQTITHQWTVPSGTATQFNDVATATFQDNFFHETLGTAEATASSTLQTLAASSGATATIQDVESMTGSTDYDFSVDSVTLGTGGVAGIFSGYSLTTPPTHTRGPVTWNSGTVSDSGSTIFNKTVYVNGPTTGTATLADTATISPAGQGSTEARASSVITGGATVSIVINKTMDLTFTTAKTFTFTATPGGASTQITIPAGSYGPVSGTISGLQPGVTYTVNEAATAPFGPQSFTQTVTLPSCSATRSLTNTATAPTARVQKITVPNPAPAGATDWVFTLTGVQANGTTPVSNLNVGGTSEPVHATANLGYVPFTSSLDQDGATYTITETTTVTNWDLTSVIGDFDGVANRVTTSTTARTCSFTLNLSNDVNKTLSCTFTNTQQSRVRVLKTQNGGVPTLGYSFELKNNAGTPTFDQTLTTSAGNGGTLDFGYLPPGSYTLCELHVPAATDSTLETFYGGVLNSNGDICLTFTLLAGADRDFTIDNHVGGGSQRTIGYWKYWNTWTIGDGAEAKAAKTGNHLMDEFLPQALSHDDLVNNYHAYVVTTAQQGVSVLSSPSSKYAENQLAAQLLAAELNKAANASICQQVTDAIVHANALLTGIGYAGPVGGTVGQKHAQRTDFLNTAKLLDNYNNALVC